MSEGEGFEESENARCARLVGRGAESQDVRWVSMSAVLRADGGGAHREDSWKARSECRAQVGRETSSCRKCKVA